MLKNNQCSSSWKSVRCRIVPYFQHSSIHIPLLILSFYPSLSLVQLVSHETITFRLSGAVRHSLLSASHWLYLSTAGHDPLNFVVNLNSLHLIGCCLVMCLPSHLHAHLMHLLPWWRAPSKKKKKKKLKLCIYSKTRGRKKNGSVLPANKEPNNYYCNLWVNRAACFLVWIRRNTNTACGFD